VLVGKVHTEVQDQVFHAQSPGVHVGDPGGHCSLPKRFGVDREWFIFLKQGPMHFHQRSTRFLHGWSVFGVDVLIRKVEVSVGLVAQFPHHLQAFGQVRLSDQDVDVVH